MRLACNVLNQVAIPSKCHPCLEQTRDVLLHGRPVFPGVHWNGGCGNQALLCAGNPKGAMYAWCPTIHRV